MKTCCFSCHKKVRAYKQFMIHTPPNVLTLQLKRYVSGATAYKLNRHLNFPLQLDLRPFVTEVNESSVTYKLYAVLVHYGMTTTSGHYYCFVLAPSGRWYKMNDATVCHSLFCRCCTIWHCLYLYNNYSRLAFSALTVLVGRWEGHPSCKKTRVLARWCWWFECFPVVTTASFIISCCSKIQDGMTVWGILAVKKRVHGWESEYVCKCVHSCRLWMHGAAINVIIAAVLSFAVSLQWWTTGMLHGASSNFGQFGLTDGSIICLYAQRWLLYPDLSCANNVASLLDVTSHWSLDSLWSV